MSKIQKICWLVDMIGYDLKVMSGMEHNNDWTNGTKQVIYELVQCYLTHGV